MIGTMSMVFLVNTSDRGVVIRRVKLRVPNMLPSGYLKDSAPPKVTDICHRAQAFNAKILWNIGWIRNHMVMVDAGEISGNRASV